MTAPSIQRAAGLGLSIGAVLFVAHIVLRSLVTAGVEPAVFATRASWVPINALGVAGAVLVLLALPAMYAHLAAPSGRIALVGVALVAVAWLFFAVFLSLYGMLILPWLAAAAPSLVSGAAPPPAGILAAFLSSLLAWLVGTVLFGVPFVRGALEPRWVGYLLSASGLWMLVGNLVIAPGGPAAAVSINLLSNLGPVLLSAALGYLGVQMWSSKARDTLPPSDILKHFALPQRKE
jgi:hypothetical protein